MRYLLPTPLDENAPGKYYVIDACNGCGLCKSVASDIFGYTPDGRYYYIQRQPQNHQEEESLNEAIDLCLRESIRDDGDVTFFDIWN